MKQAINFWTSVVFVLKSILCGFTVLRELNSPTWLKTSCCRCLVFFGFPDAEMLLSLW